MEINGSVIKSQDKGSITMNQYIADLILAITTVSYKYGMTTVTMKQTLAELVSGIDEFTIPQPTKTSVAEKVNKLKED